MKAKFTEKEINKLRKLLAEGLSSQQAAERLGTGRTRNSIIGFVHRHGEKYGLRLGKPHGALVEAKKAKPGLPRVTGRPLEPNSYQRQEKVVHPQFGRRKASKIKAPSLPGNENLPVASVGMKQLIELEPNECRFAITSHHCTASEHRFCGAPVANPQSKEGRFRSYCAHHAERAKGVGTRSEREAHKASTRIDGGPLRRAARR